MDYPLISIVLCTYNGGKFLREQLDSILQQTYSNIEIIISDDASTDDTKEILLTYQHYPSVRLYFNEKNIGHAKNFEVATKFATADYIAFADQDDIWLPEKTAKLFNAIGTYTLVYSNSKLIDEEGNYLNKNISDYRQLQDVSDSRNFIYLNIVSGHTMIVKRELLQYAFPVPEGQYHDWWLASQAANMGGVKYLDEALTLYRQHEATVTKTIVVKKSGSRKYAKRYADFMKDLNWINALKNSPIEKHKIFFERFYYLYSLKSRNWFVWPLFFFLLKNEKVIFKFAKKNSVSIFLEIRKLSRGEKNAIDEKIIIQ